MECGRCKINSLHRYCHLHKVEKGDALVDCCVTVKVQSSSDASSYRLEMTSSHDITGNLFLFWPLLTNH